MPRQIRPAVGSNACATENCGTFTKHATGYCATCRSKTPMMSSCCFCNGFDISPEDRYFCGEHAYFLKDEKFIVNFDITAHVASTFLKDYHRDIVMRFKPVGQASKRRISKQIVSIHTSNQAEVKRLFTQFYGSILHLDAQLARLIPDITPPEELVQQMSISDSSSSTPHEQANSGSEDPLSESDQEGGGSEVGSGLGEDQPSAAETPLSNAD